MQICFKGTKGIAKYLPKGGGTFYLTFETNEISKISPKRYYPLKVIIFTKM